MAKKIDSAKAALSAGVDSQFQGPQPKKEPRYKRKTYLLTNELIADLNSIAAAHGVGINDLVRSYLQQCIDASKAGELTFTTKTVTEEETKGRIVTRTVIDECTYGTQ